MWLPIALELYAREFKFVYMQERLGDSFPAKSVERPHQYNVNFMAGCGIK
jgi:hypothetical protein